MRYYSFSGYARIQIKDDDGNTKWEDFYVPTTRLAAFNRRNAIEILRGEAKAKASEALCIPESRINRVYFKEDQLNRLEPQAIIIR